MNTPEYPDSGTPTALPVPGPTAVRAGCLPALGEVEAGAVSNVECRERGEPLSRFGGIDAAQAGDAAQAVVHRVGVQVQMRRRGLPVESVTEVGAQGGFPVGVVVERAQTLQEQVASRAGPGQLVGDDDIVQDVRAGGCPVASAIWRISSLWARAPGTAAGAATTAAA